LLFANAASLSAEEETVSPVVSYALAISDIVCVILSHVKGPLLPLRRVCKRFDRAVLYLMEQRRGRGMNIHLPGYRDDGEITPRNLLSRLKHVNILDDGNTRVVRETLDALSMNVEIMSISRAPDVASEVHFFDFTKLHTLTISLSSCHKRQEPLYLWPLTSLTSLSIYSGTFDENGGDHEIARLTWLRKLAIDDCHHFQGHSLAKLVSLEELELSNVQRLRVVPLVHLTRLQSLAIYSSSSSFQESSLYDMHSSVKKLDIYLSVRNSLSFLSRFTWLEELSFYSQQITDIELFALTNLRKLSIRGGELLTGLFLYSMLDNLRELNLWAGGRNISRSVINCLTNLQTLYCTRSTFPIDGVLVEPRELLAPLVLAGVEIKLP
jgi:Leucine-rich repeat (LRR) protein